MTEESAIEILEKLKSGELEEYLVSKSEFISFRQALVKREDFKRYRGIAKRGGDVLYHYSQTPNS